VKLDADIIVVGGGPVGACAGALLARAAQVLLLEPAPSPPPPAGVRPAALRVSAISRASERILQAAGAWDAILPRANPYERMHVWHESSAADGYTRLVFDAAEVAEPNLGWIIENSAVQQAVLAAFQSNGGVLEHARLLGAHFGVDAVEVETSAGTLRARLLIGADGARSAVRELAGISATVSPYSQTAIVATVTSSLPHASTAWQRFMRTGTLALLPLGSGTSSIVWSVGESEAERLLRLDPPQFERELVAASDGVLGELSLASARAAFALQRLRAARYVNERCALVGDAAHVVHPLAGQGVNLGFLDAAALAQLLGGRWRREDIGAFGTLRRYERWRLSENRLMDFAIDTFNRFLAHGQGPASALARRGLGWVDQSVPLKRLFVRHALGLEGDLPGIARAAQ
jgi:2-octaprenylphenol hydroxylase